MIARQRQNLTLTFAAQDQTPAKPETISRLATNQSELQTATAELAAGLAERGADVTPLQEAAVHMQVAESTLRDGEMTSATMAEQMALASLIRARQNIRKMLSQSNSQASDCRKFDKQQRDKLRTPEQRRQDQQQKLAEARAELDQLAQQERKWSEELKQSQSAKPSQQDAAADLTRSASEDGKPMPRSASEDGKPITRSASEAQKQGESQSPSESSGQASSNASSSAPKSREQLADEQRAMQAKIDALREQIEQLGTTSEASRQQAQDASETAESSLEQLQQGDADAAAKDAERTAEQIERLTDHLAAMNATDVGQRLDQARQSAQDIAARQAELAEQAGAEPRAGKPAGKSDGKQGAESTPTAGQSGNADKQSPESKENGAGKEASGKDASGAESQGKGTSGRGGKRLGKSESRDWARDERDLARRVDMLSELLAGLRGDSLGEKGGLKESLDTIHAEQSPHEVAGEMRQAAADLEQGRGDQAARGAGRSRDNLQDLAKALGDLRKEFAQPQLQELLELEQQLAKLQQQLERGERSGESTASSASTQAKWSELAGKLDAMAAGDSRLAEAMKRLRGANQRTPGGRNDKQSDDKQSPQGFQAGNQMPETSGLRDVNTVVQMKIQEAILAGTLLDGDQAVPPEYRQLVDEYYKALSDDLR